MPFCDQGPGRRRFGPHAKAAGPHILQGSRLRGAVRAQRAGGARAGGCLQARCGDARHPHAADGRPGLSRPHHDRAPVPGRHGVLADRRGRRGHAAGPAPGSDRLRRQARRRDLAAYRRADRRTDHQGARCIHRADTVERPPQGARQAPHRPGRAGNRRPRKRATGNPVDATAGSRGVPSAKAWCWSAPRPADRRHWKRC